MTLNLIRNKKSVRALNIVEAFKYSSDTARSYLSYLSRNGLLVRKTIGYTLSEKGIERLKHFEASGCKSFDCPLCLKKKPSHITCKHCNYQIPKEKAHIQEKKDYLIFEVDAGVYCPSCDKLIFSEQEATAMGLKKSEWSLF